MDVFDQKIAEIRARVSQMVSFSFSQEKLDMVAQVLRDQYWQGQGGGGRIQPPLDYYPYQDDYIKKKARRGLPTDRVTLYFDGVLYDSLNVTASAGQLDINFEGYSLEVIEWIEGFYGADVFSPNGESMDKIKQILAS